MSSGSSRMALAFPVRYHFIGPDGRWHWGAFTVPATKAAEARVIAREMIAARLGARDARMATLTMSPPR